MARRRRSGSRHKSQPSTFPTATTTAGQRRQVWEGRALKTKGGLTKTDLRENKQGKIVSKRASSAGKRAFSKNGLGAYSYRGSSSPLPEWFANLDD